MNIFRIARAIRYRPSFGIDMLHVISVGSGFEGDSMNRIRIHKQWTLRKENENMDLRNFLR